MNNIKSKSQGIIFVLILAALCLIAGIGLHLYRQHLVKVNLNLEISYQTALQEYQANNIYYTPQTTIDWLASRQNSDGYFVTNPDLINEPSQLNKNSLRATRYSLLTLKTLGGMGAIDQATAIDFILARYHSELNEQGEAIAGFSTELNEAATVRPTMDAILALQALSALDNPNIDLSAIKRFILSYQNPDGGFWDPHYPQHGQLSCLKCSSFALRALGVINRYSREYFSPEFTQKMQNYLEASWDKERNSFSELLGGQANDSYDIFRAFIILWNLKNTSQTEKADFTLFQLPWDKLAQTLNAHFPSKEQVFSRKFDSEVSSMKATHLMVWMFTQLDLQEKLNRKALLDFVFSKQSSPGEYGADIYNTYSATGILSKLNVATSPLEQPAKPQLAAMPYPDFLPYLLYFIATILAVAYFLPMQQAILTRNKKLELKVNKDPLTGSYNREYLDSAYHFHMQATGRLALIVLDIDHFKAINDTHGHLVGDSVLKQLSQLIQSHVRSSDVLIRWGGEEFAILCPATNSDDATTLAEHLRALIEGHTFATVDELRCSFGVSGSSEGDSMEALFERADKALYQSKSNGRNRVTQL